MAARGGMTLRLGDLLDVEKNRRMRDAHRADTGLEGLAHARIVPGFYPVNVDAVAVFGLLKAFQYFRDGAFRGLELAGDGDAITVIPNEDGQGHLQYPRGGQG